MLTPFAEEIEWSARYPAAPHRYLRRSLPPEDDRSAEGFGAMDGGAEARGDSHGERWVAAGQFEYGRE